MKTKIAIASAVLGLALLAAPVFAQTRKPSPLPTPKSALSTSALRACQAKEAAIKNRMTSLTDLAKNIEKVFDSIATKVEDFYTNTVLPSGKTVSNYDTLVANIATKKGVVDADLSAAQDLVNSFSCDTGNPKTLLTNFRIDMQKVKTDLQGYRTSIKNLIVAVRPMAPEASESPEATPSATP